MADLNVVALDAEGDAIYRWQIDRDRDAPTSVTHLEGGAASKIAIQQAASIVRSDGYIIKSPSGVTGFLGADSDELDPLDRLEREQSMEKHPTSDQRVLRRVELPPPAEVPDHTGLTDGEVVLIALWTALYRGVSNEEPAEVHVDDKDIVLAKDPKACLTIERLDGVIRVRAHRGDLVVLSLNDEEEDGGS